MHDVNRSINGMNAFAFWVIGWLCPVMLGMGYLLAARSSDRADGSHVP
jgi:hypothetical protein